MTKYLTLIAQAAVAAAFALCLFGQIVLLPLVAAEAVRAFPEASGLQAPGLVVSILFVACVQVALIALWQLLTMVRRSTIFTRRALRFVDVIIVSCAVGALLCVVAWIWLASVEAMQPGVVLGLIGALIGTVGVATVLLVMRTLLLRATTLERDMAEVI